jgi:hypothetical protein
MGPQTGVVIGKPFAQSELPKGGERYLDPAEGLYGTYKMQFLRPYKLLKIKIEPQVR